MFHHQNSRKKSENVINSLIKIRRNLSTRNKTEVRQVGKGKFNFLAANIFFSFLKNSIILGVCFDRKQSN